MWQCCCGIVNCSCDSNWILGGIMAVSLRCFRVSHLSLLSPCDLVVKDSETVLGREATWHKILFF